MRLTILGLAIAGLALVAPLVWAQDASVFDQYVSALGTFGGVANDPSAARAQILDGLEGDWFPIGGLEPTDDDPKLFAVVCEKSGVAITVPNDFSFETSRKGNADTPVTTIYTSRQGHEFGSYSDPAATAAWLGIDAQSGDPAFDTVLGQLNGTVTINRPTPDILVIQKSVGGPDILARCAD